jgi:sodium-coupled monocarboxylate transporter 8/12
MGRENYDDHTDRNIGSSKVITCTTFNIHLIRRHWCSHFSAVTVLVLPADVFRYGGSVWLCSFACVLAPLAAIFVYMPVFFRLQHISIYEYFEKRFDERTKMLAFVLYVLSAILYFPLVTYAPALAFAAGKLLYSTENFQKFHKLIVATGVSVHLTAFVICAICVFYTTIGGLKAVVWTDFLQFAVITASLLSVYVIGTETSGGFSSVWNTALNGEIFDIFK